MNPRVRKLRLRKTTIKGLTPDHAAVVLGGLTQTCGGTCIQTCGGVTQCIHEGCHVEPTGELCGETNGETICTDCPSAGVCDPTDVGYTCPIECTEFTWQAPNCQTSNVC